MINNKKIPQLRFRGFTDNWETKTLGEIFQYERPDPYIVKNDTYSDLNKTPVLTANKAFILGYTNETRTYHSTSIIFDDFTLDNKYVDFPYMVKSSAIKILTIKDPLKDSLLFAYELLNLTKIEIMGHARHYISVVQPTKVYSTHIKEQEKIGNFFQKLDTLIELRQQELIKLKNIKKAMLSKLFPQNGSLTPQLRFRGFTDNWETKTLGEISSYRRGSFPQPYGYKKWYNGIDSASFVQVVDVGFGLRLTENTKQLISKLAQPKSVFAPKGTVVVTLQGSIGRVALTQYDAFYDRTILIFENYTIPINTRFWAYSIQEKFAIEKKRAPGGTIKTITKEALSLFLIFLPSEKEQEKIGNFFQKLDTLIELRQQELIKLKNIKKAYLDKMFI